jgi:hypothetical protein
MRLERHGWVAFALLLLPRLAVACPMCASQQHGGAARIAALGGMLLLPFAIAFVVFGALRRAGGLTASLNAGRSRRRRLWLELSSFRRRQRPPPPQPERWWQ